MLVLLPESADTRSWCGRGCRSRTRSGLRLRKTWERTHCKTNPLPLYFAQPQKLLTKAKLRRREGGSGGRDGKRGGRYGMGGKGGTKSRIARLRGKGQRASGQEDMLQVLGLGLRVRRVWANKEMFQGWSKNGCLTCVKEGGR